VSWSKPAEIVGVAADSRADGIDQAPMHTIFQADTQTFAPSTLLVRTTGAPTGLTPQIVETIRQLDPNRPIDHVQTLEEIRNETIAPQRLNATLIGLFAALALAIATVGVAGVLAFSVSQRTNELGIRVALGAQRTEILRMILGEGAAMALVGLAIGGAAAVPLSQLLTGLLFGIEPADPATIAASALLLVAVAIVAAWPNESPASTVHRPPPRASISRSDSRLTKILAWNCSPQPRAVTPRYSRSGPPPCPSSRRARRDARTFGSAPRSSSKRVNRAWSGCPLP
jgi:hypothetical protein